MIRRPVRRGRKESALDKFVRKIEKAFTVKKPSSKEEKDEKKSEN